MDRARSERAGKLVFALAVANLLVLAAGLIGWLHSAQPSALPEFNAEKIQLRHPPDAPRPAAREPAARLEIDEAQCLAMEGIDQARFETLRAALSALAFNEETCRFLLPRPLGWWVFWPPVYEAAERERVMQALRAAGVREVLPIRSGPMMQAFSLAVFDEEAQARAMRDGLRQKGLDGVQYGPRPHSGEIYLLCRIAETERQERLRAVLPPGVTPRAAAACRAQAAEARADLG